MTTEARDWLVFGIVAAVLFVLLMLTAVVSADAMTVVVMPEDALRRGARAIVVGKVQDVTTGKDSRGTPLRYVTLAVSESLKGARWHVGRTLTITEEGHGGWVVPGTPEYEVGEEVVVAVSRRGGALRTYQHGLGVYRIDRGVLWDSAGRDLRKPGVSVIGEALSFRTLGSLKDSLRDDTALDLPLEAAPAPGGVLPYRLFNNVRWFQPDSGQPVGYLLDPAGDAHLGLDASSAAIRAAFAAWSQAGSGLTLETYGTIVAQPRGCDGKTTIAWNDPHNAIDLPVDCSGVLALGGYCAGGEQHIVNGVTFSRVTEGDITMADGWAGCGFWTEPNVAEVMTHELGHTIGLAHSEVKDATMSAYAHFDGRGATLKPDDVDGVRFIYPAVAAPTATPLPTTTPTATQTAEPSPTVTATPVPLGMVVTTDLDDYAPGERAYVIVRTSEPMVSVRVEIQRRDGEVLAWRRSGRVGTSRVRRWAYRVPKDSLLHERFVVSVHAEKEGRTAECVSRFQVLPLAEEWSRSCSGL